MFEGRKLLIATQHGKEKIIAPIFEKEFGITCIVNQLFNTDSLGTFSGEIERKKDVIETLRQKCFSALHHYECDLVIASEGSFGTHPSVFFLPADEEHLMLLDVKNNLEIIATELSNSTNFNGTYVATEQELLEFSSNFQFPSHGIILKSDETNFTKCYKGITNKKDLILKFNEIQKLFGKVFVETDMRACYNPTRMKVIEQAAHKLVKKINTKCPTCDTPGYEIKEVTRGLPCNLCNSPTKSALSVNYQCQKCLHKETKMFPKTIKYEDPMYCDYCNP